MCFSKLKGARFVVLCLVVSSAFCQQNTQKQQNKSTKAKFFRATLGFNRSNFGITHDIPLLTGQTEGQLGYNVGVFFESSLGDEGIRKKLAYEVGVMYSKKSTKTTLKLLGSTFSGTDEFGFLEIPLLGKYYWRNYSFGTGFVTSFLVSGDDSDDLNKASFVWRVLDMGWSMHRTKGFGVNIGFDMGLGNLGSLKVNKYKIVVSNFSSLYMRVSWRF